MAKPLAGEAITTTSYFRQRGFHAVLRCRAAALPLSARTLAYLARGHPPSPQEHRVVRALDPGRQALLVLAYLRKGDTFAELAAGSGIGCATAWRYVTEAVALLAARAPKLRRALTGANKAGHAYIVIDGTFIPIDRVAAGRPFYSGKHRRHGMNLQVISAPDGEILWVSGPLPGAVHDLSAARIRGIIRELAATGPFVLADKGYHGAGDHIRTPCRGRNKPAPQKEATPAHAQLRSPGERANAQLKNWRIPRKLRCCPRKAASSPRPSTSFKPTRSLDEKGSMCWCETSKDRSGLSFDRTQPGLCSPPG
jgi:DDE superfamily endonuclease/Helix-turn-helix of DDE superfamily endonuclease